MTETTDTTDTTTKELPKAYRPADFEAAIYERWLAADVFAPDGAGSRADPDAEPFTIIQPPPNITGLAAPRPRPADRGRGPDDPARPDARPPDALPARASTTPRSPPSSSSTGSSPRKARPASRLGRERYLERMWQFINETREVMLGQQRRVGASFDWSRLRFTMDEGSSRAVREAFFRLYRDGLAYRTEALVNWCPGCRTSVSATSR